MYDNSSFIEFNLTKDHHEWFGDRITEGASGKVSVKKPLIKKARQILAATTDLDINEYTVTDESIKDYLIRAAYNSKWSRP